MDHTECRGFWALVDEYIDGELDPRLRTACEAHVAGCPECRRLLARARKAKELLASGPRVEPGREFRLALRGRLEAERVARRRREWAFRSVAAILAPAAVAVTVLASRMPVERVPMPDRPPAVAAGERSLPTRGLLARSEPPRNTVANSSVAPSAEPVASTVARPARQVASRRVATARVHEPEVPAQASGAAPDAPIEPTYGLDRVLDGAPALPIPARLHLAAGRESPSYVTPALMQAAPPPSAPALVRPLPAPDGVFAAGRDTTYEV